ncbi:MAG: hypothetical protein ACI8WL_001570 [Polaribacter sp.]|jgi:hypothetical protein
MKNQPRSRNPGTEIRFKIIAGIFVIPLLSMLYYYSWIIIYP